MEERKKACARGGHLTRSKKKKQKMKKGVWQTRPCRGEEKKRNRRETSPLQKKNPVGHNEKGKNEGKG